MTSWSQLIENIQKLLCAFEEDITTSRCLSSRQLSALHSEPTTSGPTVLSERVTSPRSALLTDSANIDDPSVQLLSQQQNCHDGNRDETVKSRSRRHNFSRRLTVPTRDDMPTSFQTMPSQLQPLKSKPYCQLQKKYKYVNKKFIVCKETRKGKRDTELLDKEPCEQSNVNDPFEFVGTQSTPASTAEARDQWSCAEQLTLFEETSVDELSLVQHPVTLRHRRRRQQQQLNEKAALKQLAENIANAESYSLIISQKCLAQSQNDNQTTANITEPTATSQYDNQTTANMTEPTATSHDATTSEIVSAAGRDADEIHHSETAAGIETDVDIVCMPDRQPANCDFVNNKLIAASEWGEAADGVVLRTLNNSETEQRLHSAQVSHMCSASCLRSSGDGCDSECQVARMPCAANTVNISTGDCQLLVGIRCTSSDVSVSQCVVSTQHSMSPSKTMTVASLSAQKTCPSDACDICRPAVAVNDEHSSQSVSVGGCDRIIVKRSRKQRRKAQQKKCKSERIRYDNSTLQKLKSKPASPIDSDVEGNSSG